MKHTENIMKGFYFSKHHNTYRVIVDKYSGNDYRVVKVYDDCISHLIGKSLRRGHGFKLALKKELNQFD